MMYGTDRPRLWRSPAPRDLWHLIEALPDAVLVVRADAPRFTIAAVSDMYLHAVFSYAGHPRLIGRGAFEVFTAGAHGYRATDVRSLRASFEQVIRTRLPQTLPTRHCNVALADGTRGEQYWNSLNVPVLGDHNLVEYIIHRVEDVTEIVRLSEANSAKVRFLASMSHELRTPLNAIGGYVDLLSMGVHGPVNEAQREVLERIRRSERHLLGLINEVLNYAKIESGRVQLEPRRVRVSVVVEDVLALVTPQAEAKQLRIEVTGRAGRQCHVDAFADTERFRQILINLVSNAVKFTKPGGVITIDCEERGSLTAITVSDTGIGVPADDLPRIFEPFVQVDPHATNEGTGLGLSISRDLARAMGGDLIAHSRLGDGSTFTLLLPRARRQRDRRSA